MEGGAHGTIHTRRAFRVALVFFIFPGPGTLRAPIKKAKGGIHLRPFLNRANWRAKVKKAAWFALAHNRRAALCRQGRVDRLLDLRLDMRT